MLMKNVVTKMLNSITTISLSLKTAKKYAFYDKNLQSFPTDFLQQYVQ